VLNAIPTSIYKLLSANLSIYFNNERYHRVKIFIPFTDNISIITNEVYIGKDNA